MHASTRGAALRAAVKVTLSASALSCGGVVGDGIPDAEALTDARADVHTLTHAQSSAASSFAEAGARADAATVMAGPCSGETSDVDGSVSGHAFACCTAFLEKGLFDAGEGALALDASAPESRECCATIVAFVDHGGFPALAEAGAPAESVLESCCGALSAPDGPPRGAACTPWGPPVPPAMPVAFALEVA
jgi:hypothetical protein